METGLNLNDTETLQVAENSAGNLDTLIALSELPEGLRVLDKSCITPNIMNLCNHLHDFKQGIVYLTGLGHGKTTNAAGILLSYLYWKRFSRTFNNVGFFVNALELCRLNSRKYDERFDYLMHRITDSQCVVVDGVPNYMTLFDEQLIEEIYEKRLYADGITVFTSSMVPDIPANSSIMMGRALTRIASNCKLKEVFNG